MFSKTSVGDGSKIDNLVQIAHNVEIGRHCIVCAQVGISGSTTIEDFVVVGGQAGLAGHLTVHRGAKIDGLTRSTLAKKRLPPELPALKLTDT